MILPLQHGHPQVPQRYVDLLDGWQGRVVLLFALHLNTELGQGLQGRAHLRQDVGAGAHKAKHGPVKGTAVGVAVGSAGPGAAGSLRTTGLTIRPGGVFGGGGAGELGS